MKNKKEKGTRLRSTDELFWGGGGWLSKGKHLTSLAYNSTPAFILLSMNGARAKKKKREKSNMPSHVTENSKSSS